MAAISLLNNAMAGLTRAKATNDAVQLEVNNISKNLTDAITSSINADVAVAATSGVLAQKNDTLTKANNELTVTNNLLADANNKLANTILLKLLLEFYLERME